MQPKRAQHRNVGETAVTSIPDPTDEHAAADGAAVAYFWDTTTSSTRHGVNAAAASAGDLATSTYLPDNGTFSW